MSATLTRGIAPALLLTVAALSACTPTTVAPDALAADADVVVTTVETPNEDEAGWNCFTHGNGSCGDALTVTDGDGAILGAATDSRVYVSWRNGRVTHATAAQREAAWTSCVDAAWYADDPSDSTLRACDESFMEAGDDFRYDGTGL